MDIILKKEEAQALVNYLATRPYQEVYTFVPLLLAKEEEKEPKK